MERIEKIIIFLIVLSIPAIPTSWVFGSYMEAKAYNEVTGSNVSTWNAMWIELRVQAGPGTQEAHK